MSAPLLDSDPRQLGGYWLAARLGAGGQGVVYEGYGAQGDRVAVKMLHADAVTEAVRNGLRKEVATLQRVASFCTARILTADLDHFPPYIVSEYVPGPDLRSWVEHNGGYGPDELYRLAIGIATALSSIHRAGVVHRDLKPANVLLGPDGPRVIDFGIAKTDEMSRSATGLKGTPRWMAPELFRGQRASPAVDVWAWGVIVLYAATGTAPFDGRSLPVLMHQITTASPDTSMIGEPLRGFVDAALNQDPAARPLPEEILVGLIGGETGEPHEASETRDPLEEGKQAAAKSAQPAMRLPPSLAELAEQVYGGLDPRAQQAVPRILLRMVVARPDADDVLCAVRVSEFADGETDQDTVLLVLDAFRAAGLLRDPDGADAVAIATPALLRAWPRMRDWVEAERGGLNAHHVLADAARRWDVNGRKPTDLLQGSGLDEALAWASTGRRQLTLNLAEQAYLAASVEQTRRRARTRTIVTAALAALLLVATIAGGAAGVQSWNLSKANSTVSAQRDSAIGRQVAAQALQLRRTDPALARRLAVAAASLAGDTPETHHALLSVSAQLEQDIWAPPGVDGSWYQRSASGGGPNVFWSPKQQKIIIADAGARRVLRTIHVTGPTLQGVSVALGGKRLLARQQDGTMTVWDVATGTARRLPHKHKAGAGLFPSPTGAKLIKTDGDQITVLETDTGKELFRAEARRGQGPPELSPDERTLAMAVKAGDDGEDGERLAWWDLSTGKELDGQHSDPGQEPFAGAEQLRDVVFSPDGRFLATRIDDRIVVLSTQTRAIQTTLSVPKNAGPGLDFSRDGNYIAADMTMWSTGLAGGEGPYLHHRPDRLCFGTRFSHDAAMLRCVDAQGQIRSIDISRFTHSSRLSPFPGDSTISQDGTTLAVRAGLGVDAVQIWDTAARTRRATLTIGHPVESELVLSPDGRLLGLPARDGTLEIWDVRAGTRRLSINTGRTSPGSTPPPAFSPDGKAVAVMVSNAPIVLKFWDTATGRQLGATAPARAPFDFVSADSRIVWSRDGRRVISTPALGVVGFPSGKTLLSPGNLGSSAIRKVQALNPQGVLATVEGSGDQRSLIFWDAGTLRQKGTPIRLPVGNTGIAALSPDGRLAATADSKGNIDIWDVRTQRRVGLALTGNAAGQDNMIESLAFSADSTRVHSMGGSDMKLLTHIVATRPLKDALCDESGQLTPQQWRRYVGIEYRETC
ncbi:WD40 repeat domain-containing serine/threonine protein kinase [Spirillospora sp. CA-255316]